MWMSSGRCDPHELPADRAGLLVGVEGLMPFRSHHNVLVLRLEA